MAATVLSFAEVSEHNTKKDCWLIINGKVYDVEDHPGGDEGRTQAKISRLSEFYGGDVNLSTIPTKINYRPPKQPHC